MIETQEQHEPEVFNISISKEQLEQRIKILKFRLSILEKEMNNINNYFKIIEPELYLTNDTIIETISNIICSFFGTKREEIFSEKRHRRLIRPRYFFIYFVRQKTKLTLTEIGVIFARDHTTCTYAVTEINKQLSNKFDDSYREDFEALKKLYEDNILKSNSGTHLNHKKHEYRN